MNSSDVLQIRKVRDLSSACAKCVYILYPLILVYKGDTRCNPEGFGFR